ncbi:hypothetical protein D9M69_515980 [compost metagenome]
MPTHEELIRLPVAIDINDTQAAGDAVDHLVQLHGMATGAARRPYQLPGTGVDDVDGVSDIVGGSPGDDVLLGVIAAGEHDDICRWIVRTRGSYLDAGDYWS